MFNSKQKKLPLEAESEIQQRKRQFVTLLEFFVSWPKLQVHQPTSCKERHRTQSGNISLKSKNWKNEIKANGVIGPILQNIPILVIDFLTQYMIGVQPSMVTHWKVVSMASMMLSKLVIPWFGPVHFSRQIDSLFLNGEMVWKME